MAYRKNNTHPYSVVKTLRDCASTLPWFERRTFTMSRFERAELSSLKLRTIQRICDTGGSHIPTIATRFLYRTRWAMTHFAELFDGGRRGRCNLASVPLLIIPSLPCGNGPLMSEAFITSSPFLHGSEGISNCSAVYRAQLERDRVLGKLDFSWTGPMWIIERQVMD